MTPKQRVRQKYPHAYSERYKLQFRGGCNLIWSGHVDRVWLGDGETQAEAWRNAAKRMEEQEK